METSCKRLKTGVREDLEIYRTQSNAGGNKGLGMIEVSHSGCLRTILPDCLCYEICGSPE